MYLVTFFRQFDAVVGQLVEMFPDDTDFKVFRTFLGMLQKTAPATVIGTFNEHVVVPFETKIDARDETFIMTYTPANYGSDTVDIISKIRGYWLTLSPESKDCMWQYIYILKELCKRYYAEEAPKV